MATPAMHQPILLVDDSAEVALLVRRYCRQASLEVVCHRDAESAWQFVQLGDPIALILVDVHLPGASGIEFCRWLQAVPGRSLLVRTALLGSWDRPQDIAAALQIGVSLVVAKDLLTQPTAFLNRLQEILGWLGNPAGETIVRRQEPWPAPRDLADRLNYLISARAASYLGEEALNVLLGRADRDQLLRAGAVTIDTDRLDGADAAARLDRFLLAFAERLCCMMGMTVANSLLQPLGMEITRLSLRSFTE